MATLAVKWNLLNCEMKVGNLKKWKTRVSELCV